MPPTQVEARPRRGALTLLRRTGAALLSVSRSTATIPLLAWAVLIWALSSQPPRAVVDHVTLKVYLANCAHAVEFGVLALLVALTLPRSGGWPRLDARGTGVALLIVAAYATLDELHQGLTPGRNAAVPDVLTDLCGAACTLWIAAYVVRPDATEAGLARRFVLGLLVCFASGGLATIAPSLFPDVVWL